MAPFSSKMINFCLHNPKWEGPSTQGHMSLVLSDIGTTIIYEEKWEAKVSLNYERGKTRQMLPETLVRINAE